MTTLNDHRKKWLNRKPTRLQRRPQRRHREEDGNVLLGVTAYLVFVLLIVLLAFLARTN